MFLQVGIHESLSGKNVILVISGLDISEDDIKAIHNVYDELKSRGTNYEIVWIPIILESNHEDDHKKYEYLRSTMKWYSIQFTTKISGMRYLEEKWQLREDPLVVVLSPQSEVVFMNAIHLIRVWGTEAIDFKEDRAKFLLRKNWPDSTLVKFTHQPRLQSWVCINFIYLFLFSIFCIDIYSFQIDQAREKHLILWWQRTNVDPTI